MVYTISKNTPYVFRRRVSVMRRQGIIPRNICRVESRMSKALLCCMSHDALDDNYCSAEKFKRLVVLGNLTNAGYGLMTEVYYKDKLIGVTRLSVRSDNKPLAVGMEIKQWRTFGPFDYDFMSSHMEKFVGLDKFVHQMFELLTSPLFSYRVDNIMMAYRDVTIMCNQIHRYLRTTNHPVIKLADIDRYPDVVRLMFETYGFTYQFLGDNMIRFWKEEQLTQPIQPIQQTPPPYGDLVEV